MNIRLATCCALFWLSCSCTQSVAIFARDPAPSDGGATDFDAAFQDAESNDGELSDGNGGEASLVDSELGPDDGGSPSGSVEGLAAFGHTCAIAEGTLYCWGRNTQDQLGLSSAPSAVLKPSALDTEQYRQVCAGEEHTCAVRADDTLVCWGSNRYGQLGLGDLQARSRPALVSDSLRVAKLACGGFNTCAITPDGALLCWGNNYEGQAGQADPFNSPNVLTPSVVALPGPFADVSVGQGHVCALQAGGALFCWGRNTQGQLGIADDAMQVRTPTRVSPDAAYRAIAAALAHSCAVRTDGRLFCWGNNLDGLLGTGSSQAKLNAPMQVGTLNDYESVSASWFHSCALRAGGRLACWGRNVEGQLGLGDTAPRSAPSELGGGYSQVVVAQFHSCAVRNGALHCWGKNEEGELGLGVLERKNVPTWVPLP